MKAIIRLAMAVTKLQWSFERTKEGKQAQTKWYGPSLCLANELLLPRGRVGTDPHVIAGGLLLVCTGNGKSCLIPQLAATLI